jgi:cytidyltransferase-like protein
MRGVAVSGSFDDLQSRDIRFLQEAARLGKVHVYLWTDEAIRRLGGEEPRFLEQERFYLLQAIRYVTKVTLSGPVVDPDSPWSSKRRSTIWVVDRKDDSEKKRAVAAELGLSYSVLAGDDLACFSEPRTVRNPVSPSKKKVIVTGCFDWLHSGHIRFFEEVSQLGLLYVGVGHDDNIRLLKGDGHPMLKQEERRYLVASVRYVEEAFIASGHGWTDAEPEVDRIRPDIFAVNEDGDRPEKREFCTRHGIEYVVLQRRPQQGLPWRNSTTLRGWP